ncbi:hypothetical protein [Vibrio scophthalmi]|nr:hypothetical protein [Vibrio scophthalmi]
MAIEQDAAARAYNNSVDMGALKGGMSQDALEATGGGTGWKAHWSGSTTGSVAIPANAKEIFVMTSVGNTHTFPKNAGAITLDTVKNSRAVAKATFNGSAVSGQVKTERWLGSCASESHTNCSKSATAKIAITKVMYK